MYVLDSGDAEARVLFGIISGIGFIGGGAILKDGGIVSGTATAASIWTTGAIGIAVAFRRYEIAILLSLMNFVTLSIGQRLKEKLWRQGRFGSDPAALGRWTRPGQGLLPASTRPSPGHPSYSRV